MIQLDLEEFNLFKHVFVFENFSALVKESDQSQTSEFWINPLLFSRVTKIQVVQESIQDTVDPD